MENLDDYVLSTLSLPQNGAIKHVVRLSLFAPPGTHAPTESWYAEPVYSSSSVHEHTNAPPEGYVEVARGRGSFIMAERTGFWMAATGNGKAKFGSGISESLVDSISNLPTDMVQRVFTIDRTDFAEPTSDFVLKAFFSKLVSEFNLSLVAVDVSIDEMGYSTPASNRMSRKKYRDVGFFGANARERNIMILNPARAAI